MLTVSLLFLFGLLCLIKGGDWFVDAAIQIAKISGLSQVLIGATVVSVATTLPELIVSSTAAFHGETTMSVGNAVGSMICNIGFVLSIAAIFGNIVIRDKHFKIKSITLVLFTFLLIACSFDGIITTLEAIFLIFLLLIYLYTNVKILDVDKKTIKSLGTKKDKDVGLRKIIMNFIVGLFLIFLGSNLIVENGIIVAKFMRVPTAVISLTIIALGTSLPELVIGISSILKGNEEISVGNIIGANIFNISLVIGTSGLISELKIIPQNLILDMPIALLLSLVLIIPSLITKRILKIQGLFMLSIYFSYIIYMIQSV
nr:calcium/sodium antiporter [Sedimentibacter sp.]